MSLPVLLCTNGFRDVSLSELAVSAAEWGFDGFEAMLAPGHWDLDRMEANPGWFDQVRSTLHQARLDIPMIASHGLTTAVADPGGPHLKRVLSPAVWGDGNPEGVAARAAQAFLKVIQSAERFGIGLISGFTGSPLWHRLWTYPGPDENEVSQAFEKVAQLWRPLLDHCLNAGVRFALEIHPGQMAFDIPTAHRLLESLDGHQALGFVVDPSHMVWQGVDPVQFVREFPDRIWHVHLKDVFTRLDGGASLFNSCVHSPHAGRAVEYRLAGRGCVDWESLARSLSRIGYSGSVAVEGRDPHLDRAIAAAEGCQFGKRLFSGVVGAGSHG